ncbi:MAG: FecR family protein [Spirochaetes bacterium]|nr:FecR family protein [Spirochaetota bacterium]
MGFLFFLGALLFTYSEDIGEVSYIQQGATLVRDTKTLPLDFSSPIENYDLVRTNSSGLVEIQFYEGLGIQGSLLIKPASSLYIDLSLLSDGGKARIELLSGTVTQKAIKLAGKSSFEVRAGNVSMGVRGTTFEVATVPDGSILISCAEGQVRCETEDGTTLFAEPGSAVESTPERGFRNIPIMFQDLETFRRNWHSERVEAFRANAHRALRNFANRYLEMKGKFDDAYKSLMARYEILEKWVREDRTNRIGAMSEVLREKRSIAGPLLNLRKKSFLFEKVYYRLVELREYYKQGMIRGDLGNGMTAEQFFRRFDNEAVDLEEKMNVFRQTLKLFAKRNEGVSIIDTLEN